MKLVYWSPYIGHVGTIKAVINSAIAMRQLGGHDVLIVRNHSEWEGYEQRLEQAGVRIVDFGLKRMFPGLDRVKALGSRLYMLTVALFGFFQLRSLMHRERPDVLITNLISVPAILAAVTLRRRPRIIASIQGFPKFLGIGDRTSYPLWMTVEDALRKRLWNLVYPFADLVVCMTESTREKLLRATRLPAERVVRINNPIIDDQIHALAREPVADRWLFDAGHLSVIAIGRLTRQKDFITLIRAAEIAGREVPLRLAILGEGEERGQLEAEIAIRRLDQQVRLYGFVRNPYAYLSRARLFVLTSLWEDPGHAILEAAALRIPIVATDCPTGPAALLAHGAGGDLCAVGDVDCLALRIAGALRTPDSRKAQVAWENAAHFSLRAHFDELERHLRRWSAAA